MTKEEALEQLDLLKLARQRINREIRSVMEQFCKRDDHHFVRLWERSAGGLARVIGYVCLFCEVQKLLEIGERCPICNGLNRYEDCGPEDVAACVYCGWNNLQSHDGIPVVLIPKGGKLYLPPKISR